ncbi:MAG TPA: DUF421 domain-containing protein [Verrucomicrobia bacterium]|nr:DUF421 domain-containing protein [Verrucomicrobiota bacterium]HOB32366.1 DUF421 domain-containing protein [Verrucomicrobiota bacterium]HOP96820.1 DUF421 domain-containing protein [Verrucomicrobiota bacterium]
MEAFNTLLGLHVEPRELGFLQVCLRGIIVFVAAIVMIRLGDKRFMARKTAFDVILAFMLASFLARAVNGSAAFWPTIGGGFVLVGFHRAIAWLARHWHWFGNLVKGTANVVIRDGKVLTDQCRRNDLSERDILEELRLNGKVEDPSQVKLAMMERSGEISVVLRPGDAG